MNANSKGTVLITGASSGIGAVYADRFGNSGHDLILVGRSREQLEALATRLTDETSKHPLRRPAELWQAALSDRVGR